MTSFINVSARRFVSKFTALNSSKCDTKKSKKVVSTGSLLWKRLSLFVGLPIVCLAMINAYVGHQADHHQPRPEFVKYEYLRMRTKRFPWGDGNKSLFHNSRTNALPDGYEDEQ